MIGVFPGGIFRVRSGVPFFLSLVPSLVLKEWLDILPFSISLNFPVAGEGKGGP